MGERLMKNNRLLDHLVQTGVISDVQLRSALAHQKEAGGELLDVLIDAELVGEIDLARGLANFFRFPLVNLSRIRVTKQALKRATGEFCRRQQVMPFGIDSESGDLLVAVSDPAQVSAIDALRFRNGQNVKPYVAPKTQLKQAVEFYYFGPGATGPLRVKSRKDGKAVSSSSFKAPESSPRLPPEKGLGFDYGPLADGLKGGQSRVPLAAPDTRPKQPGLADSGRRRSALGPLNALAAVEPTGVINDLEGRIRRMKERVRGLESALRQEIKVSQALAELLVENGLISTEQLRARLEKDK